jgi:hypothetical protein
MIVYVLGESLYVFIYSSIEGLLNLRKGQDRWMVYGCEWLFRLRSLFKEMHHFFELIFRARRTGRVPLFIHYLEEDIVFLYQIIYTSATILYGGGKTNVCRWL